MSAVVTFKMNFPSAFDLRVKFAESILAIASWALTLVATLLIVVDICMRYLFNSPLPATWEVSELLMPWIVFLPFAYTLSNDAHVRVTLITSRLRPHSRRAIGRVSDLICVFVCGLLAYRGWGYFWESFSIREEMLAAISLPWWLGKLAMPLGLTFFTLRYALGAIWPVDHQFDKGAAYGGSV